MKREREEENELKISKSSKRHKNAANDIYINLDLQVEILKKLPSKSLLRFRCVSKQWLTIIGSTDFIDLIIARPLAEPPSDNLHFIFHQFCSHKPFFVFSSTYTDKEQKVVPIPLNFRYSVNMFQYVRGLILCLSSSLITIYNPTTRQSISLPEPEIEFRRYHRYDFFGYDPVMNQYKVMCVINGKDKHVCKVYTLGDPMKQWRNIQGIEINHYPTLRGVHINGIIYYKAFDNNNYNEAMVMSFDFKSERFYHVKAPDEVTIFYRNPSFVNYKGKLGCIFSKFGVEMWVMEDSEKQRWSKFIFDLPLDNLVNFNLFCGVTLGGEIFTVDYRYDKDDDPLSVYFYDPKQNRLRKSEIKGTTQRSKSMIILGVSNHVENMMSLQDMA